MSNIKQTISHLIYKHGTNDPFEIASQNNILVLYENLGNIMGYFNANRRIFMIHINHELDEPFQRFVCAHELGHAILHPTVNTPFLRRNTFFSIDKIEREANQFAVELLMPDDWIYENLSSNMTIYEAATNYGIPKEIVHLKSF